MTADEDRQGQDLSDADFGKGLRQVRYDPREPV